MTESRTGTGDFDPRHKDDFDQVYDLEDPRPYFRGLRPTDYRMPGVVADFLRSTHDIFIEARGAQGPLRLIDFGCGYGTIGALARHHLEMRDLYAHYADRWLPSQGRDNWPGDREVFRALRRDGPNFEIGGVDIAGTALEYAGALGFIDAAFTENLATDPPSPGLRTFLAAADLVVESGSAGALLVQVAAHLLAVSDAQHRPWFLYCPRPDVDWAPLNRLWRQHDYVGETCNARPVHYRKPLGDYEREDVLRLGASFGQEPGSILGDDYLLVDLMLARPIGDTDSPSIETLRDLETLRGWGNL